ncbi:glyoxalase [Nocardia uniformis]|uniref:Glyoxalase n=1 Tax=Nocardia uniformis TaxID=53432 RepID=A0A849BSX6_9NOCA|nr:glyoxalase [Nocardia uniformis]NNH69234.1 glyoxalase [Nocardia uniformis]
MAGMSIPVMWGGNLPETLDFYRTLGYRVTSEQTRPYTYGVVERDGYELHFGPTPKDGVDAESAYVGCLALVDEVEELHADFTAALRARYGRVPARGIPRITRFRPGQTRFTVVDPVGNSVIYIRRDEPDVEYGGSTDLEGLARVLDNARILRESKLDDKAAARAIEAGLKRFGATAPAVERGRALAQLAEIAVAAGDSDRVEQLRGKIGELELSDADRAVIAEELSIVGDLADWLSKEG